MKQSFHDAIQKNQGKAISEKTQTMLNAPWSDPTTSLSKDDKAFLDDLIHKIEDGDIQLHMPSSILHHKVYDKLPSQTQAKVDLWIQATLAAIRRVHDFYHNPYDNNSDMMIAMVRELRLKKEMLEKEFGDVLKI